MKLTKQHERTIAQRAQVASRPGIRAAPGADNRSNHLCASMYARSSAFIRDWYPAPCFLNHAITSESIRSDRSAFFGTGFKPCAPRHARTSQESTAARRCCALCRRRSSSAPGSAWWKIWEKYWRASCFVALRMEIR